MPRGAIIALDLATNVGFARWSPTAPIRWGSMRLPSTGSEVGRFLSAYDLWLRDLLTVEAPETVIFEAPWVGPSTHQDVARKLMCLAGHTEFVCYRREVPRVVEENNKTVRKHFLGSGGGLRKEIKALTVEACRSRGWTPEDDDAADALALLDYAMHQLRVPGAAPGGMFAGAVA